MLLGSTEASCVHGMMDFVGVRAIDWNLGPQIRALISATVICNQ